MNKKVHFFYIIGILLAIIILIVAGKFGNNEAVVTYLSFALTFTSLFLALIAIIYAFISNSQLSNNLNTINSASNEIEKVSKSLDKTNSEINSRINEIPSLIRGVEQKVEASSQILKEISKKPAEPLYGKKKSKEDVFEYTEDEINAFLDHVSFSILKLLYIFHISKTSNKSFNFKDVMGSIKYGDDQYSWGATIVLNAMQLIEYNSNRDIWTITFINPHIESKIKKVIKERAKSNDEHYSKIPEKTYMAKWNKDVLQIEKYFEDEN